eukprot:Tbor_TRINITY_DN6123_c1_g1::TRINITY_DN6123_c1_g1_i1::g.22451::m.22451/K00966/GMPP; mannose-1-phosphate guanylyltransferase
MRALILVGGYGTRLRPLTMSTCKPLVPFCNKPMIIHQVEALKAAGVTSIILAIAYRPEQMKEEMDLWSEKLGVTFIYSHEKEPLGTAGPLALAREELCKDNEPFFVLNSDVTCEFPLKELLEFHKSHGGEGSILVTKVKEPQHYGVVVYEPGSGKIERFVEKPKEFVGDCINAGIYCLSKSVLDRIKLEKTSIETQVFPKVAEEGKLFAMPLSGFWKDIGQPHDYIAGISSYLLSINMNNGELQYAISDAKAKGYTVYPPVIVDPTANISAGAVIGPYVTIGRNTSIEPGARIQNTAVFDGCKVMCGAYIHTCIIGWRSTVGGWCRLVNNTVLGEDVQIGDGLYMNGVKVLPNKVVNQSYDNPTILM